MNYNIRKATNEDIPTIWEIGKDVTGFETAKDIVTFWPKSILENCINKRDVMIKIIEVEEKTIGFTIVNINLSLKKAELENLYIIDEYRHNGYGKVMLLDVIDELEDIGIENICAMSDDAVDFLVRNGFTQGKQFYWMDLALSARFKKEAKDVRGI